jgi:hypothetical protein
VQRLDAPVHHLREAGEVVDRADLDAGLGEAPGGAAGRDDLDAEVLEPLGELDEAALVGDRQQGALDADLARGSRGGLGARTLGDAWEDTKPGGRSAVSGPVRPGT